MIRPILLGTALGALSLAAYATPSQAATARFLADAKPTQSVDFTVHVPLRNSAELDQLVALQGNPRSPMFHHFLTPAQFRASFAATPASVAKIVASLRKYGITVKPYGSQLLHATGTASAINAAFHTQLGVRVDELGHASIAARSHVTVPAELSSAGATVAGIGATIKPRPMFAKSQLQPDNRSSTTGGYWFDDLKQAYAYPSYQAANGKGVTVATVGDSDFSSSDAALYFKHEGLTAGPGFGPEPVVDHVVLPGAAAFDPNTGISDEANLDVQMVGGSAPGAHVLGVSIGGPGEAFLNAYAYLDESNSADIVSTSYGECELYYTAAYNGGTDYTGVLLSYHDIFRQGNVEGITFIFSSGDESGLGCYPADYTNLPGTGKSYPAIAGSGIWVDDPNVTGVGGTNLITKHSATSIDSSYVSENEIGDRIVKYDPFGTGNFVTNGLWGSGSGTSVLFAKPAFQDGIAAGGRVTPDVSMHMGGCPFEGAGVVVNCAAGRDSYDIAAIGGQFFGLIGTSASAPEFAGLLAVKESVLGSRLGNENLDLYALAAKNASGNYFRQGFYAYNGVVRTTPAQKGYSPILGVGTPIGANFVGLPSAALAGLPRTHSNP